MATPNRSKNRPAPSSAVTTGANTAAGSAGANRQRPSRSRPSSHRPATIGAHTLPDDNESRAISEGMKLFKPLNKGQCQRVLAYLGQRFGVNVPWPATETQSDSPTQPGGELKEEASTMRDIDLARHASSLSHAGAGAT